MQGISVNHQELTQVQVQQTKRPGKWVPTVLMLVGSIALAFGLFVAVITVTRTPANHDRLGLAVHTQMYVGGDTCFTCHDADDPIWSFTSSPVAVASAAASETDRLVEVSARVERPQLGGVSAANVKVLGDASDSVKPRYIIATVLETEPLSNRTHPGMQFPLDNTRCADCHSDGTKQDSASLIRAAMNSRSNRAAKLTEITETTFG